MRSGKHGRGRHGRGRHGSSVQGSGGRYVKGGAGGSKCANLRDNLKIDKTGRYYMSFMGQREVNGKRPEFKVVAYQEYKRVPGSRWMISYTPLRGGPHADPRDVVSALKYVISLMKKEYRADDEVLLSEYPNIIKQEYDEELPLSPVWPEDKETAYLNVVKWKHQTEESECTCIGAELLCHDGNEQDSVWALIAVDDDNRLCSHDSNSYGDPAWFVDSLQYILDLFEEEVLK